MQRKIKLLALITGIPLLSWAASSPNTAMDPGFGPHRWWIESSHVRMVEPRPLEFRAIPIAWTPPTHGVLKAPIVVAPIKSEKDLRLGRAS